jgi:hypothetical protein
MYYTHLEFLECFTIANSVESEFGNYWAGRRGRDTGSAIASVYTVGTADKAARYLTRSLANSSDFSFLTLAIQLLLIDQTTLKSECSFIKVDS